MKILIFLFLSGLLSVTSAQNVLTLSAGTASAGDTVTVYLSLSNADTSVALQCDITLPLNTVYVDNSAIKGSRCISHSINAVMLNNQTLRVILYSQSRVTITGNTGIVAGVKLLAGTAPGSFPLVLSNASVSNPRSANILTSLVNGQLTISAPDISLSSASQNFGSVPWYSNSFRNVTIRNNGNAQLVINRIYVTGRYFSISGDTTYSLAPGSSGTVTILFHSLRKGLFKEKVFIVSNDPDSPMKSIDVSATGYAVNELRPQSITTRSGSIAELPVSVNNMEKFTGLQFDLKLPTGITYSGDGAYLSSRSNNHSFSVSMPAPNTLRCVVFSPGNKLFYDSSGTVVTIKLRVSGNSAIRTIITDSVFISDSTGTNIVSSHFNSSVTFTSPDISGPASVNLGECSLTDSISFPYSIQNVGNDTLTVTEAYFINPLFKVYGVFPTRLRTGDYQVLTISFSSVNRGSFTAPLYIRSNDPDEDPYVVQVTGSAFAPNYLSVRNITAIQRDTLTVKLDMTNFDPVVAFQTDIQFPAGYTYVPNSAYLTTRKSDHSLSIGDLGGNKFRLFAYSVTGGRFTGNSGTLMELKLVSPASPGTAQILLSNAILSDTASQNVLKSVANGTINLLTNIDKSTDYPGSKEELGYPYPNPFRYETRFTVNNKTGAGKVITILNSNGEIVRTFEHFSLSTQMTLFIWDGLNDAGKQVPAGVYYLTVRDNSTGARKIVYIK